MMQRMFHPRSVPLSFSSRVGHERFEMELVVREQLYWLDVMGSGRYEQRAVDLLQLMRNYFEKRPMKQERKQAGKEERWGVVIELLK